MGRPGPPQAASATFTPTFQSVLPDILADERDYTQALSASQVAVSLENLASPLLAAALLLIVDFDVLFLGTAIGFLISAALVLAATVPPARRSVHARFVDRLRAGIVILAATPRLRAILALNLVVASCGVITVISTVNVARDLLGGTDTHVALLLAVAGAGAASAAAGTPRLLRRRSERTVMLAGAVLCVLAVACAVALSLAPGWPLAAAVWTLIGVGTGLIVVPIGRVIRASTTPSDRPAVLAAQFSLSHLCWLLSYPLTGWLGSLAGFTVAWGVLLLLVGTATATALALWPRTLLDTVRHAHDDTAEVDHLAVTEWNGSAWVHTHRIVIDQNHPRWPAPA